MLNHFRGGLVRVCHYPHLNDGSCVLGNDDIVVKEEQCEELLAKSIVWLFSRHVNFDKSLFNQFLPFVFE